MWLLNSKVRIKEGQEVSIFVLKNRLVDKGYLTEVLDETLVINPSSVARRVGFWGTDILLSKVELAKKDSFIHLRFLYNIYSILLLFVGCYGGVLFMMSRDLKPEESIFQLMIMFGVGLGALALIVFYSITSTVRRDVRSVLKQA